MDFFNQYDMPYVYQSATGYEGCHIKMEAELPTVTMPRIKVCPLKGFNIRSYS